MDSSYARGIKDLQNTANANSLGVKLKGVKQTRNSGVIIEVGNAAMGRTKSSSAIKVAVGNVGNICATSHLDRCGDHLISMIQRRRKR